MGAGNSSVAFSFKEAKKMKAEMLRLQTENKRLYKKAYIDGLTGIPNRVFFEEEFEKAWEEGKKEKTPLLLVFMDGDGLKAINDSFGHSAGDKYIIEMANFLASLFHSEDFAARIGGDEFVVLMPDPGELKASEAVERILEALSDKYVYVRGGTSIKLRMSVGAVKGIPEKDFKSPEEMLTAADASMYRIKGTIKKKLKKFFMGIYLRATKQDIIFFCKKK